MPEHNLIQAPDLMMRLQEALGIRQAHIAPTLSEGVQPVVVVHDLTHPEAIATEKVQGWVEYFCGGANRGIAVHFRNPKGSGRIYRFREIRLHPNVTMAQNYVMWGLCNIAVWDVAYPGAAASTIRGFAFTDTKHIPGIDDAGFGRAPTNPFFVQQRAAAYNPAAAGPMFRESLFTAGWAPRSDTLVLEPDELVLAPGLQITWANENNFTGVGEGFFLTLTWSEEPEKPV